MQSPYIGGILSLLMMFGFVQVLTDNPLADFVELPDEYRSLRYSNLLPGVIRGALEMVRGFASLLLSYCSCAIGCGSYSIVPALSTCLLQTTNTLYTPCT